MKQEYNKSTIPRWLVINLKQLLKFFPYLKKKKKDSLQNIFFILIYNQVIYALKWDIERNEMILS